MQDFKESLLLMVLQMGFVAVLGLALAITAIAQALPWIILAGAVAICLVSVTVTGCIILVRGRRPMEGPQLPPPVVYIVQPDQSPRLLEAGKPGEYVIENSKARKQIGRGK